MNTFVHAELIDTHTDLAVVGALGCGWLTTHGTVIGVAGTVNTVTSTRMANARCLAVKNQRKNARSGKNSSITTKSKFIGKSYDKSIRNADFKCLDT